jgi:hypothetical protein
MSFGSFASQSFDDTLLDGNHVVTITALAVGGEATSVEVTIFDVEMVAVAFDQLVGSPGDLTRSRPFR